MMKNQNSKIVFSNIISVAVLCLLIVVVYFPGLEGGFIFDDHKNLQNLKVIDDKVDIKSIKSYIAESSSGPLKRPISMVSFLVDATNWPAEAYSFKRTNLIIHCLNSILLFFLIRIVLNHNKKYKQFSLVLSFFASFIWALHPLMVSTTLYVVQRMAMLPLTFSLLGLITYLKLRLKYYKSNHTVYLYLMVLSVGLFTLLAVFSKENGVLLILYILLFEIFIIRKFLTIKSLPTLWYWIILKIPALLLLSLLLFKMPDYLQLYEQRPFTVFERLLTQFRVLSLYLYDLFLPKYLTVGVFGNWIEVSKGLLTPIQTLYSFLFISGLLIISWVVRNKFPIISFAILFYFTSHILESTFIPLDLYYEHRNYVASLFFGLMLVLVLFKIIPNLKLTISLLTLISILLMFLTTLRVQLWSNNLLLHQTSYEAYPLSVRGTVMTAFEYSQQGYHEQALEVLRKGQDELGNLDFYVNEITLKCVTKKLKEVEIDQLINRIKTIKINKANMDAIILLFDYLAKENCLGEQDKQKSMLLAQSLIENKHLSLNQELQQFKYQLIAELAFSRGDYADAAENYIISYKQSNKDFEAFLNNIIKLMDVEEYDQAIKLLNYAESEYAQEGPFNIDWYNVESTIKILKERVYSQIKIHE